MFVYIYIYKNTYTYVYEYEQSIKFFPLRVYSLLITYEQILNVRLSKYKIAQTPLPTDIVVASVVRQFPGAVVGGSPG